VYTNEPLMMAIAAHVMEHSNPERRRATTSRPRYTTRPFRPIADPIG
jgi:hypothetical protein